MKNENVSKLVEPVNLADLQFEDGFWTADNAPIYFRRKKSLKKIGTLCDLSLHDTFYVELWDGPFAGKCYFMKVVRVHENAGYYDCLWLSKKRRLLRNIIGRAMYSCIANATPVYATKRQTKKRKNLFASDQAMKTVKTEPKADKVPKQTPSGETVTPKKEPFPLPKKVKVSPPLKPSAIQESKSNDGAGFVQRLTYL